MVSKTATLAIRALAYMATLPPDRYTGAPELAGKIDAGGNYLGKILQTLAHEGLVISRKGLNGGFRLARDPNAITLYDVVAPIDRVERWTDCILSQSACRIDSVCPLHDRWVSVRDAYLCMLRETTLFELASQAG